MRQTPDQGAVGTLARLEHLVDRIEANPGRMIDPREIEQANETIDVTQVAGGLQNGLTDEDFAGVLKLAMLTECATESYAAVFRAGAVRHDAPWLARFTERVWVPDERTHASPYISMLRSLGFDEADLLHQIRQVQEAHYEHCCGLTPVELTTYGMVQEQLTDQWHGLIATLLKPAAPHAAQMAYRVKARERLHTIWYREMTAIQVAGHPALLGPVADTVIEFEMPGVVLVPELQGKALRWMPNLGVDFTQVARELVRNFSTVAGSTRRSGELLADIAVRRGFAVGPFPLWVVRRLLAQLGGLGFELLGEAILQRVGLPPTIGDAPRTATNLPGRVGQRMRASARSFIANRIDLRAVTGETAPAT